MQWIETVVLLLLISNIIETGKASPIRYITPVLQKLLKIRKPNEIIAKNRTIELFYMSLLYDSLSNDWMTPIERARGSIHN